MMLPPFFSRLPRGLKLVMLGLVAWLVGLAPFVAYFVIARVSGDAAGGPGVPGAIGFALNIVALALVLGGLLTWLRDGSREPPSRTDGGAR